MASSTIARTPVTAASGVRAARLGGRSSPALVGRSFRPAVRPQARRSAGFTVHAHSMEITTPDGKTVTVDVPDGTSLLDAALDSGIEVPHDCKLGVCMTCPAKLESGTVDQTAAMLSEDVVEKGYALLCVAFPESDVKVKVIDEDELLEVQLVA